MMITIIIIAAASAGISRLYFAATKDTYYHF